MDTWIIPHEGLRYFARNGVASEQGNSGEFILRQYAADVTLDMAMTVADFTEPTYNGYQEVPVFPYLPEGFTGDVRYQGFQAFDTGLSMSVPAVFAVSSSGGPSDLVYGWYLAYRYFGAEQLVAVYKYDTPLTFANPPDFRSFAVRVEVEDRP